MKIDFGHTVGRPPVSLASSAVRLQSVRAGTAKAKSPKRTAITRLGARRSAGHKVKLGPNAFAHLTFAALPLHPPSAAAPPRPAAPASSTAILSAGAKRRGEIGRAKPTGLAKKILAAGAKRRGETRS